MDIEKRFSTKVSDQLFLDPESFDADTATYEVAVIVTEGRGKDATPIAWGTTRLLARNKATAEQVARFENGSIPDTAKLINDQHLVNVRAELARKAKGGTGSRTRSEV